MAKGKRDKEDFSELLHDLDGQQHTIMGLAEAIRNDPELMEDDSLIQLWAHLTDVLELLDQAMERGY